MRTVRAYLQAIQRGATIAVDGSGIAIGYGEMKQPVLVAFMSTCRP